MYMRRIFIFVWTAALCLCSCDKEVITPTFESDIQQLYGDYNLSDIHWPGLAVDLNADGTGYWSLLYEFQNKVGYYEPDYTANVTDGIIFSSDEPWAEPTAAFNVTLPYPHYIISEGKWLCTDIRNIKVTLRATEATFNLASNCCWIYPGYTDQDDVLLLNIQDISLYVEALDDKSFKVGIHCTLPHDYTDGTQKLDDNYLYYTFSKQFTRN